MTSTRTSLTSQALQAFESTLKNSSRTTIRYALVRAAFDLGISEPKLEFVQWHTVDALTLQTIIGRWSGEMAGATLSLHISALKGIFRSCFVYGLITHQKYLELSQIELTTRKKDFSCGVYVDDETIRTLMDSCACDERRTLAARDQALISILFGTVIGRTQAVQLQIEDLDLVRKKLCISSDDGCIGDRILDDWSITPMREWLFVLAGQGQLSGPVLRRVSNGGRALNDMQAGGLYIALRNRCIAAGVPILKPRDARRTVATNLITAEGRSLAKITVGSNALTATLRFNH